MPVNPEETLIPMLYDSCTYLDVAELGGSTECSLCSENYGWRTSSETPVQLRCGHVFGLACISKWVSTYTAPAHRFPPCPLCRADFLNVGAETYSAPLRPLQPQTLDDRQRDTSPVLPASNARLEDTPQSTGHHRGTYFSRMIENHRLASAVPIEEKIERWV